MEISPYHKRSAWNPNWLVSFESNWSIINKFCTLNLITPGEFKNFVADHIRFFQFFRTTDHFGKWNYNAIELLNNDWVSEVIPGINSETTALSSVMPPWIIKTTTSYKYLRFCPYCLAKGYHCTLYQLLFIKVCLIHHVELKDTCGTCGNKIGYDLLHNISFGCPHCRTIFWLPFAETGRDPRNLVKLSSATMQILFNAWEWLKSLDLLNTATSDSSRSNYSKYFEQIDNRFVLQHWRDVVPVALPCAFGKPSRTQFVHTVVSSSPKEGQKWSSDSADTAFSGDYERDICAIFKSVYRHISKCVLPKVSRQCYRTRCLSYSNYLLKHCPQVKALAMWLNFWTHCDGRKINVTWDFPRTCISVNNVRLENWTVLNVFALEIYWSFWNNYFSILSHISALKSTQTFHYSVPYWLVQIKGERMYFHHWCKLRDLKRLELCLNTHTKRDCTEKSRRWHS